MMSMVMCAQRQKTPGSAKKKATPKASSTISVTPVMGLSTNLRMLTSVMVSKTMASTMSTARLSNTNKNL
jgi:hypothetical protein